MNTSYKVALWPTRLAALPVGTLSIEADTPLLAAILAMKEQDSDAMGVIVVMDSTSQHSFFDAAWRGDELFFSRTETFPRGPEFSKDDWVVIAETLNQVATSLRKIELEQKVNDETPLFEVKQAMEQLVSSKHTLKLTSTIGCYYSDERGEPWTTFTLFGNGTVTCLACGKAISGGYSRGKLGDEDYFCGEHVHIEQA